MAVKKPSQDESKVAKHSAMSDDMLNQLSETINKEFGEGISQRLSSSSTLSIVNHWTSTRSMVVDKVLAGGRPMPCSLIPFGRQTEISGLPSTGKTTLCAQIAAEVQSLGGFVVVIDTEERIDHPYWQSLGVDTNRILNMTCRTLEEVFERQYVFIETCMKKWPNTPVLMLWDSLGGTSTDRIMDDEGSDSIMERASKAMMVKAKVISAGMEIINPMVAKSKVAYVYTNTMYMKPNVKYGSPWTTPGGEKKNFYATVRIRLEKTGDIKHEDPDTGTMNIVGQKVNVETIKNSMAPRRMSMDAVIIGGVGYSDDYTVWEMGTAMKVITKDKAWSTWKTPSGTEIKFQGWSGFVEKVVPNPEYPALYKMVEDKL